MNKDNKNTFVARDRKKTQSVHWVSKKFNVTQQYVYGVLNGHFKGGRCEEIRKSYQDKYEELKKILS